MILKGYIKKQGFHELLKRVEEKIKNYNCKILKNTELKKINLKSGGGFDVNTTSGRIKCKNVIFTAPLEILQRAMKLQDTAFIKNMNKIKRFI